jgi:hypothetical protein
VIGRTRLQIVVAVVVLVFAGGIWLTGGGAKLDWLRYYSVAVVVAGVVLKLWDGVLWHTKLGQRVHAVVRDVRGTWKGTLHSRWVDPATGARPAEKPAYLVVRQTSGTISVSMFTNESRSESSLGRLTMGEGRRALEYMYSNNPANALEERSRRHNGSVLLEVVGDPVTRMTGYYWTDRDSKGDLEFAEHVGKMADDYTSAEAMFTAPPKN